MTSVLRQLLKQGSDAQMRAWREADGRVGLGVRGHVVLVERDGGADAATCYPARVVSHSDEYLFVELEGPCPPFKQGRGGSLLLPRFKAAVAHYGYRFEPDAEGGGRV